MTGGEQPLSIVATYSNGASAHVPCKHSRLHCIHSLLCDRYHLSFEDRTELGLVASGAVLMDHGVNVTRMDGAEASEVVWLEEDGGAW